MKRSLLYIGILFSAVSCGRNDHALQSGDLLFQAGESSDMTGAITAATGENGRLNFSHVGIAVVKNGADSVLGSHDERRGPAYGTAGIPRPVGTNRRTSGGRRHAIEGYCGSLRTRSGGREITSDSPTTTPSGPTTGNSIAVNWSGNVTGQATVRRSSRPVR